MAMPTIATPTVCELPLHAFALAAAAPPLPMVVTARHQRRKRQSSAHKMQTPDTSAAPRLTWTPEQWSTASAVTAATAPAPKRPYRSGVKKPWYAAKRDEKEALEQELVKLHAIKAACLEPVASRRSALRQQQQENARLRRAIQQQRLVLARAESAIAGSLRLYRAPLERYIHLGARASDRIATFSELKRTMLCDAERYVAARTQCLDRTLEYSQLDRFTLANGDLCFAGLDIIPLTGFRSVQHVYEVLRRFYFNIEIAWTEHSNDLMLRVGDYESGEPDVATQRFVRSTRSGVQIESNSVLVSMLRDGDSRSDTSVDNSDGSVGASAVMVIDYVDVDELYPYASTERLRHDITGVTTVRAYPTPSATSSSSDVTIVLTQSFFGRLHHSEHIATPPELVNGVTFGPKFCSKTMLAAIATSAQSH